MDNEQQKLQLLQAWVRLSAILKSSRITNGLQYNESIVMLLLYERYAADGIGMVSMKEIASRTNMLKSLVNRTINSLEGKGLVARCNGETDKRVIYVRCIHEKLDVFMDVHNSSLEIAQKIIDIIGAEDADAFIRIVDKITAAGYTL